MIRTLFIITLSLILFSCNSTKTEYFTATGDNITLNFNPCWRFAKGSYPLSTDDAQWDTVSTPHTYHEKYSYQGVIGEKNLGPHTYRKHFSLPAEYKNKKVFIEFEGIRQRGQFYLNGHLLGRISDGVTPFGYDLTPYLHWDKENILHIEIDCNDKEFGTHTPMCWFFPGFNSLSGGICRNVYLHIKPNVYSTLPLYSGLQTEGTYVFAENISTENRRATIGIEVQVKNEDRVSREISCHAVITELDNRIVASYPVQKETVGPNQAFTFQLQKRIKGLHFWQPDYPYLYNVYTIVQDGNQTDISKITTGFRKIEVRGAELYINNRRLMTQGYTPRSQNEWPAIGAAYPDWLHDYSNKMQVDGHSRIIRWEHTMPSPQDIKSCDRVGLLQIMPGADRENDSQGREWEMRCEIMRNTIIYCRNNPSVILWEAANNLISKEHLSDMIALRDKWDSRGYKRPMGGRSEGPEWVSWMYGVRKEKYKLSIDTEYLRDESPRRWWDSYSAPYYHKEGEYMLVDNAGGWNRNQDNMCVMQSIVYEQYYKARPGTGEAVCNGGTQIFFADSESFTRSIDSFRRSGCVDGMRVPKDTYYANKTMWSNTPELWTENEPSVFIPGHWNYDAGTVKPVYVFASPGIAKVDLLVNGIPQQGKQENTFLYTFPKVSYTPGKIEAIGYDKENRIMATYHLQTVGAPAAVRMKLISHPQGLRADGSDIILIEAEIVDKQGNRAPLAQNLVKYTTQGDITWRGGYWEENVKKYANRKELPVINGIHRVILRSTLHTDTVSVIAQAEGLEPDTIQFIANPIDATRGYCSELPTTLPVAIEPQKEIYGKDLPRYILPADAEQSETDGTAVSATNEAIFNLSTAFPQGARLKNNVQNGDSIYSDRPWKFSQLPEYLKGAHYLLVANDDACTSAGEGVVFNIGTAGRVYIAYDDRNVQFPVKSSPTPFKITHDKIYVNGYPHTIYRSEPMNGGELTYLGTNSWIEKAPEGINNYIVFITQETN